MTGAGSNRALPLKYPKYVRRVLAKGKEYFYFDTGKRVGTKKVYTALPHVRSSSFGGAYATLLGHRNRIPAKGGLTVPSLIALYEKSQEYRNLAPRSQDAYSMYLRRFEKLMPTAPVAEITRGDIRRLIDGMASTPGAANLFLGTIGALFKWADAREYVSASPCKGIPPLKMGEHQPWPEHVLKAALASDDRSVRLLTHLLYFTALRLNDALSLQWSAIEGDRLKVRHTKNDRALDIKIHADLATELARHPCRALTIAVNEDGSPISAGVARVRLQEFAAELGAKVVPHGLRKNAVNALLEAGCSVAETAAVSGQTLQLVEHYAKGRDQVKLSTVAVMRWEAKK